MPANSQLFYTDVALAKETTFGTSVARTVFLPSEQPKFQPKALRHILDNGYRGVAAVDFDLIPGPGEGTFSWNGDFYIDSTPHLLMALFGTDTKTGAGDPWTHALSMNSAPPSYSLEWAQNTQPYLFAGARVGQFTLNFSAKDGALTYSVQGMSKLGTTVAATATAFTTTQSIPGWVGSVTVAGGAPASLLEGSLTFQRDLKPVHALNATQDVAAIYALGLQVTGRLTFDFTQATEYNYYAAASTTQNAVVLTFTQAATSRVVTITMSKAGWKTVDLQANDNLYQAVAQVNGIYNATDAGPAAVTILNGQTAAY